MDGNKRLDLLREVNADQVNVRRATADRVTLLVTNEDWLGLAVKAQVNKCALRRKCNAKVTLTH
jgi:hypothetical protein